MKYGAHSYLFTDRWSDDCLEFLDATAELGLDCFEVSVGDDVPFTPSLTRARAESLGMKLTVGPGGLWPADCDVSSENAADRERGLAWHRKQLDLAAELGAVAYCGAIYGHPGTVRARVPPPDEYPRAAECLHELAEYGNERGVAVVLEPMSHFRTHLVNTPEQVMRLIDMADHPNLAVLLDTYHMITEVRDYAAAIRTVRERLWGIHACESDRGVPGGGLVPWDSVFAALGEIAFDGYMVMESYNSSVGEFARRRGMFHDVCPDGYAFLRDGLRFLKAATLRDGNDIQQGCTGFAG